MKLLIVALIFISFLQSTILPINLVLLILISRSFVIAERQNLYLAFGIGIFLALLIGQTIGFLSFIYLVLIFLVQLIKKSPLSSNWITILPTAFLVLTVSEISQSLAFNFSFNLVPLLYQMFLVLPVYFLIRFWEERFVVKEEVKLKIRN